jgi:hypothetical protein
MGATDDHIESAEMVPTGRTNQLRMAWPSDGNAARSMARCASMRRWFDFSRVTMTQRLTVRACQPRSFRDFFPGKRYQIFLAEGQFLKQWSEAE